MKDVLVREDIGQRMMALRSQMYTTKMYCILLKDLTGKAPVRSEYTVPVVALARAAKQNISWTAQALWVGNI